MSTTLHRAAGNAGSVENADSANSAAITNSMLPSRRNTELAIGTLGAGAVAWASAKPISDNSLLTHIAIGRIQVADGFPETNPFLYSSTDFPLPSWWWSAALGWADQWLGLSGIRLFSAIVGALLGFVVVRASRPALGNPVAPAASGLGQLLPAVVVLASLALVMSGRPHLGGFVMLGTLLVVWRERLAWWWLMPLFAIWVNIHGSWLYGVAVIGILWVAEMIDNRRLDSSRIRWFAGVLLGLLIGGLLYPETYRLVLLPTEQFGDSAAREALKLYREWRPVSADNAIAWVVGLVAILGVYGTYRKQAWGSLMAVLLLTAMGLSAVRLLPVAAITLAAFAASGVEEVSEMGLPNRLVRNVMAGAGIALLVLAGWRSFQPPDVDLERFPVEETDWLDERDLAGNAEVKVMTNDFVGNYFEFRYGADANVFVDDRASPEAFLAFADIRDLKQGWEKQLDRTQADVLVWETDDKIALELSGNPDYIEAFTTGDFVVYCSASAAQTILDRCQ